MKSVKIQKKKAASPAKTARTKRVQVSSPRKRLEAPAAAGDIVRASPPFVSGGSEGSITIKRREFVCTLTNGSTTGFSLDPSTTASPGFDLTPANSRLFPWLSAIAALFEKWHFKKLALEVLGTNPTSAAGSLYVAADPDWDDDVPSTKEWLLGLVNSARVPVWAPRTRFEIPVEKFQEGLKWRYCNPNGRVVSEPRTQFCGFGIVAYDIPDANRSFDLWIEYEVELMLPTREMLVSVAKIGPDLAPPSPLPSGSDGLAMWFPNVLANLAGSPSGFSNVIAGTGSVPTLAPYNGQTPNTAYMLPIGGTGRVDIETRINAPSGLKPSGVLQTLAPIGDLIAYDSTGALVGSGSLSSLATAKSVNLHTAMGVDTSAHDGLAGVLRSTVGFALGKLREAYPMIKYLVPLIELTGSFVTGGYQAGSSFRYEF